MPEAASELDQKLYRLFLVGCLHRREGQPGKPSHTAHPVLGAIWRSSCYPELVNRKLTDRAGLRNLVQTNSKIERAPARTVVTTSFMAAKAAGASEHFVLLVRTAAGPLGMMLNYNRIIGASSAYPLYLTEVGMLTARAAAEEFPDLTADAYLAGDGRFRSLRPFEKQV